MSQIKAIREALAAQVPALAASYAAQVRRIFNAYAEKFPGEGGAGTVRESLPGTRWQYQQERLTISGVLRPVCGVAHPADCKPREHDRGYLTLNESTLAAKAQTWAEEAAVEWAAKIEAKLADVQDAELHGGGDQFTITAVRAGRQIRIEQQRIIQVSSKGRLFNQWPSRIYVDGKFYAEAAYKKLFA